MEDQATTTRASAAERVGDLLTSWVDRFPAWLRRVVSREFVGFAILGGFTFLIDLAILASLRAWTPLPLPVAVTVSYVFAFGLNFMLNRKVNFRSHAPVGGQVLRYAMVVVCDYGLTIGVTTGVAALGVDFRLARLVAGACVALFTYTASRRWVFRQEERDRPGSAPEPDEAR
ncbi:GtrA family protein [Saccharopolyspora pogona]|uniref:GtrA family protein n=1 Tax=Saccharopolyspora pogona TaxID=333966 RepID=UPI001682769A|nr:GtrA family protein [Saccharopolyspora pogona]